VTHSKRVLVLCSNLDRRQQEKRLTNLSPAARAVFRSRCLAIPYLAFFRNQIHSKCLTGKLIERKCTQGKTYTHSHSAGLWSRSGHFCCDHVTLWCSLLLHHHHFHPSIITPEYLLGREAAKSAMQENVTLPVSSFFCQFLHESIIIHNCPAWYACVRMSGRIENTFQIIKTLILGEIIQKSKLG
jgi:hypothetical protein